MLTVAILAICLTRRIQATRDWSKVPLTRWLTFLIYTDSLVFTFTTAIIEHGLGLNTTMGVCDASILLCIAFYLSTKLFIYYFLVEKVYIVRAVATPRFKSKLWCFNVFGLLLPYCIIVAVCFVFRVAYFKEDGTCIIGIERKSVMPLIIIDAVLNFYLTLLFIIPLRKLYSYKNSPNSILRTVTLRSFIGSLATLTSSVVNLTVLMVLKGEAAWICLMCCNADVLFSVMVLHWVTSKDKASTTSSTDQYAAQNASHVQRNKISAGSSSGGPYSVVDKLGVFDANEPREGTVTTHITAQELKNMKLEEADNDLSARGQRSSIPLGKIKVQVGRSVQVESRLRSESPTPKSDLGEDIAEVRRISRGESGRSTEELVEERVPQSWLGTR